MRKYIIALLFVALITGTSLAASIFIINDITTLKMNITDEMYGYACRVIVHDNQSSCSDTAVVKTFLNNICNLSCIPNVCTLDDEYLNEFSYFNSNRCILYRNIIKNISGNALRISLCINAGIFIAIFLVSVGIIIYVIMKIIRMNEYIHVSYLATI